MKRSSLHDHNSHAYLATISLQILLIQEMKVSAINACYKGYRLMVAFNSGDAESLLFERARDGMARIEANGMTRNDIVILLLSS